MKIRLLEKHRDSHGLKIFSQKITTITPDFLLPGCKPLKFKTCKTHNDAFADVFRS